MGNKFTTAAFLFNKLTYKYPSYASSHRIHQSFLILAWLMTTTVFPVSAIFCRKMTEKVNLSVTTVQYQKKGKSWRWKDILTSFESRLMCKGGFCHANFSSLTNVFVSITVFPLEHLQGKWQFFLFWMAHRTYHLSTGLIVHSSCWIFLTKKTQYHWQNVIFYNYLLLYNKQKKIRHAHFFKTCLHFKKASIENDLPLFRK